MMNKDSVANAVSFMGAGAAMMEIESLLTIILVLSGIVLNIFRIIDRKRD
jgi:hypothetical protein